MGLYSNPAASASELRRCRKCGVEKNPSEFRPDKKARSGKQYVRNECKVCEAKDWRRDWLAGKKGRQSAVTLAVNAAPASVPRSSNGEGIEAKLEDAILQRMKVYQSDALDALHDLAMMRISRANSMLNQVKLVAASKLAGPLLDSDAPIAKSDLDRTLAELNERYQREAPRIKAIRERIVTFEQEPSTTGEPGSLR